MTLFSKLLSKLKTLGQQRNPHFRWTSCLAQWSLGMYFATPIIAILQGSLMLNDYRVRHANAPRPIMPARGVAVAVNDEQSAISSSSYLWRLRHPFTTPPPDQPPLRLLVVGDSLAAGVGTSKSGVPILPESIARALSKALNGRAVHWTCIGTPGVAASQIVKDIHEIEPYDPAPRARQLERIVKEFQARRKLWMERRRRQEEAADKTVNIEKKNGDDDGTTKNYFLQWWRQIHRSNEEAFRSPEEIREATRNNVVEWWEQVRNRFRKRREKVEEDINAIKGIVLDPLPKLDHEDDDYYYDYYPENPLRSNDEEASVVAIDDFILDKRLEQIPLVRKGSIFRRTSVNPEAAAQYDIAVVLTGLNDVKEAFMPHMMRTSKTGGMNEQIADRKLQTELFLVLKALQDKMRGMDLEHGIGRTDAKESATANKTSIPLKRPLVVVPELPVAPLQLFRLAPLCWFTVPIFRAMENNKKFLASCFPQYVVFVEQPDLHWWTDTETGIGPIRENIQQEQLLLRVTDITHTARERIEALMKQYYDDGAEVDTGHSSKDVEHLSNKECVIEHDTKIRMIDDHDHLHYDVDRPQPDSNNCNGQSFGSNLVSVDKVHPSDEGYELWGRHIAAAIIKHWNTG
jgi:hypothetical protein